MLEDGIGEFKATLVLHRVILLIYDPMLDESIGRIHLQPAQSGVGAEHFLGS